MKKSVYFVTPVRGFFKNLSNSLFLKYDFIFDEKKIFEETPNGNSLLRKLSKSFVADELGLIQIIKSFDDNYNILGSSNRFLKTKTPYFIYCENPTALYHYKLRRSKTILGKKKLKRLLNDKNLKTIICMSKACQNTFYNLCGNTSANLTQIYPFVPHNPFITKDIIKKRVEKKEIKLLFICRADAWRPKCGPETIKAFSKIQDLGYTNISLTIVSSLGSLDVKTINIMKEIKNLTLLDFNLNALEMQNLYAEHTVLLNPTSQDSFSLVTLEAMKAGLPIITTKTYAIPEMVEDRVNGFLTEPKFWFFDKDNYPNKEVWNNRKKTIYSEETSDRIIDYLQNCIVDLQENEDLLYSMSLSSYKKSSSKPFSEESIAKQWNNLLKDFTTNDLIEKH